MPISDFGPYTASITPQDKNVESDMGIFLAGTLPPLGFLFSVYAATLPAFYGGIDTMLNNGVFCSGAFDHQQGAGAQEKQFLVPFIHRHPGPNFGIGTSSDGRQLLHDKKMLANVPMNATQEQAALAVDPSSFNGWQKALAAGYPVAWIGSWNISPAASKQVNTTFIIPSAKLVIYCRDIILQNLAWILKNEPNMQQVGAALMSDDFALKSLGVSNG